MSHAGKLFWVATILANVSFAWAGSLYVSPTGSDGNTGDADHPWLTLQHAANVVNPGDTVNVGPGTYQGFYESRSGSSDSPITWLAQSGAQITSNETHFNRDGIILYGASYVTVEGFSISGVTRAGIASQNNTNCTVRNNQCDSNGVWGVFTGHSEYFTVEDNICSRSGTQHGIYVSNSADHPIIRNNLCWGNSGCGIQINADASMPPGDGIVSYALIENNICYENGITGGAALNLDGLQDSIIRNNLLYNNHAGGLVMYMGDGAQGPRNDIVENNTIVQAADGRWAVNIGTGQSGSCCGTTSCMSPRRRGARSSTTRPPARSAAITTSSSIA